MIARFEAKKMVTVRRPDVSFARGGADCLSAGFELELRVLSSTSHDMPRL